MSREIKFRAWDTDYEKMLEVASINYCNNAPTLIECISKEDSDFYLLENLDRIVIMQYTGLKDKNDNEVYEGDIVNVWWNNGHNYPIKSQVEYREGCFYAGYMLNLCKDMLEVIGNIYENPELLSADLKGLMEYGVDTI